MQANTTFHAYGVPMHLMRQNTKSTGDALQFGGRKLTLGAAAAALGLALGGGGAAYHFSKPKALTPETADIVITTPVKYGQGTNTYLANAGGNYVVSFANGTASNDTFSNSIRVSPEIAALAAYKYIPPSPSTSSMVQSGPTYSWNNVGMALPATGRGEVRCFQSDFKDFHGQSVDLEPLPNQSAKDNNPDYKIMTLEAGTPPKQGEQTEPPTPRQLGTITVHRPELLKADRAAELLSKAMFGLSESFCNGSSWRKAPKPSAETSSGTLSSGDTLATGPGAPSGNPGGTAPPGANRVLPYDTGRDHPDDVRPRGGRGAVERHSSGAPTAATPPRIEPPAYIGPGLPPR